MGARLRLIYPRAREMRMSKKKKQFGQAHKRTQIHTFQFLQLSQLLFYTVVHHRNTYF